VPAFTRGRISHFVSSDVGVHVAAHEAVHQLQHRGEVRDAGLGPEGHAAAVADRVVAGVSPRPLLGGAGQAVPSATRAYHKADKQGDVSGTPGTRVALLSDSGETLTWYGQEAYGTDTMIDTANAVFRAKDSGISLDKKGQTLTDVPAPHGNHDPHDLHLIGVNFANGEWDDCGRMAREIMGPAGADTPAYARARPGGITARTPVLKEADKSPLAHIALLLEMDEQMDSPDMSSEDKRKAGDEVRERFAGETITDMEMRGRVMGKSVSKEARRRMRIDEFAKPGVGEAYALAPGWVAPGSPYPYHWAAVIFVAGGDRVVLEALADAGDYNAKRSDWHITTYGTKSEKQTFHHEWKNKLGTDAHTLTMASSPAPPSDIVDFATTPASDLFERLAEEGRSAADRFYVRKELLRRDVVVELTVDTAADSGGADADDISLVFQAGTPLGRTTGAQIVAEGNTGTFRMPVLKLWPIPDVLSAAAWIPGKVFGSNKVDTFEWAWPYAESTTSIEGEGARYDLRLYIE
jgi:hypothetical protein